MKRKRMSHFEDYLQGKGYAQATIRHYLRFTEIFLEYCGEEAILGSREVLHYLAFLQKQGHSPRYRNERLGAIRQYFAWQIQQGKRSHNPASGLQVRGQRKALPRDFIEYARLQKLLKDYQGRTSFRVILSLLVNQGLHSADLPTLSPEHFHLEQGEIHLPGSGKTAPRKLLLQPSQILLLHRYLEEAEPLFPSGRLLARSLQQLMVELRRLCPQIRNAPQIRSSVIRHWLKAEGLRQVQYKAGHKYVSSTERYQEIQLEELQEQLRKYHPLHRKKEDKE